MAKKSPTQLCLAKARDEGYTAQVTERWNPFARVRQDLFGFIDVLVLAGDEVWGIQCTTKNNMAARKRKILEHENYAVVKKATIRIFVEGWEKVKNKWVCKTIEL